MIIRTVTLENFGLYQGSVEFDLTPVAKRGTPRPILLLGGKNGVGKTTLLEAVRLSLYGRRALGTRVGQAQYEEYLRGRIHRPGSQQAPPRGAAVSMVFDYAEDGAVRQYRIRRAWTARGRSVTESLVIERDGAVVADVPREEWQSFLHDLIPPGVSQLFFFDGERIQEIADGDHEEEHLASAVRGLLGIELVTRLRSDLGLYLARQQRGQQSGESARLEALLSEMTVQEEQIAALSEDLGQLSSRRESEGRVAEQLRRRFIAEGGDLAARRSQLSAEQEQVTRDITKRTAELRDYANRLLPFTVAPRLTRAFRAALRDADAFDRAAQRPQAAAALKGAIREWRKAGVPPRRGTWAAEHWEDLTQFLDAWSAQSDAAERGASGVFAGDRAGFLALLDEAESTTRPRVEALANALAQLIERETELAHLLKRADDGASSMLLDELRHAEQRVGATEATVLVREEELKRLRHQHTMLERERRQLLEKQATGAAAEHRMELAGRASQALAEFERRLLDHKVNQLRREFVGCYNRLARKGDVLSDARIDPESFAVTLIDAAGRELPKGALSAGEKQIYAISVLWALARTSGRALPMIVDTPLARLDSEHRANLVRHYFPMASHQVIMLSTDTEVDSTLAALLSDSVTRSYHLEYDAAEGHTVVTEGYFWTDAAGAPPGDSPTAGRSKPSTSGSTRHALQ